MFAVQRDDPSTEIQPRQAEDGKGGLATGEAGGWWRWQRLLPPVPVLCVCLLLLAMTYPLFAASRLALGTLYPAYASYKAVRTKNVREYVKWMMYWIVFAVFTCFETVADIFVAFWFPFYYELKLLFLIWLISPVSRGSLGSSMLYRKLVHPNLMKHEEEIDRMLDRLQEQSYNTVLRLGSRGFQYVTNLIMQTAIKAPDYVATFTTTQTQQRQLAYDQADGVRQMAAQEPRAGTSSAPEPRIEEAQMQRNNTDAYQDLTMDFESFAEAESVDLGREIEEEIESPVREAGAKQKKAPEKPAKTNVHTESLIVYSSDDDIMETPDSPDWEPPKRGKASRSAKSKAANTKRAVTTEEETAVEAPVRKSSRRTKKKKTS